MQFIFPLPPAGTLGPSAIGKKLKIFRLWICFGPFRLPPRPYGGNRKATDVMTCPHIDKPGIGFQVVYPVWIGAGRIGGNKIMLPPRAFPLPTPLFSLVLIGSRYLFLLRINRNYRVFALSVARLMCRNCTSRSGWYAPPLLAFRFLCFRYPGPLSVLLTLSGLA
jgi:hypothetical protein